jgi:hypothetical protein
MLNEQEHISGHILGLINQEHRRKAGFTLRQEKLLKVLQGFAIGPIGLDFEFLHDKT